MAASALVLGLPTVAQARPASAPSTVGYDVSWPQCGSSLPTDQAFAIVGVNGGTAAKANPCLTDQLSWAATSSGAVGAQDKVQLYLNTANPGEVIDQVTTWPTSGTNRYGACDGTNTAACSFQYGRERAEYSVGVFTAAAGGAGVGADPAHYVWWLDVETGNTWQTSDPHAQENNRATLEGMTDYLTTTYPGARVGVYSTNSQWGQIVGTTVPDTSELWGLGSWMAGARTLKGAKGNCTNEPLTGGPVVLAQYVAGGLDKNHSCV